MAFKRNWVHIYLSFFVTFLPPNIHHSKKSHKMKNICHTVLSFYRAYTYVIEKNKTSIGKLLLTAKEEKIIVFFHLLQRKSKFIMPCINWQKRHTCITLNQMHTVTFNNTCRQQSLRYPYMLICIFLKFKQDINHNNMQHQDFHTNISILIYICLYLFNFNKAMNNELSSSKYCTQAE